MSSQANSAEKSHIIQALGASSDKQMQTFRMPRELVAFLKAEAGRNGRDLTGHVVRCLEGLRTYQGLPEAATVLLEADRRRMGMERHEYLLHLLYRRSQEVKEKGAGFDAPGAGEQAAR